MNAVTKQEVGTTAATERVNFQIPAVNIYKTDGGYTLEADIPGVNRDGLEIYLDQNELTLLARRQTPELETAHCRESSTGDFRRVFELDPEIDTDNITARVENGVLALNLPKREQAKPRKIVVAE
jgi:HSP20 family molecular chaperone IbpA